MLCRSSRCLDERMERLTYIYNKTKSMGKVRFELRFDERKSAERRIRTRVSRGKGELIARRGGAGLNRGKF